MLSNVENCKLSHRKRITVLLKHRVRNHCAGCSSAGHCLHVTMSHKLNMNRKCHVTAKKTNRPWNISVAAETSKLEK